MQGEDKNEGELAMGEKSTLRIKKQTVKLFEQYQRATDEETKIFLENDIISLNLNFAVHKASSYRHTCLEEEDVLAHAYAGLMVAVRTYDPTKAQFCTYASRVIENEINDALRKASRKKFTGFNSQSLDQELFGSDSTFTRAETVSDKQTDIENDFIEQENFKDLLNTCESILNDTEWKVLQNFLISRDSRLTQYDLGVLLSSSQTTISRVEKRAIQKIKDYLAMQEFGLDILR